MCSINLRQACCDPCPPFEENICVPAPVLSNTFYALQTMYPGAACTNRQSILPTETLPNFLTVDSIRYPGVVAFIPSTSTASGTPITLDTSVHILNQSEDAYLHWAFFDDGLGSSYYTLKWGAVENVTENVRGTSFFLYSISTTYSASLDRHATVITDPLVGCTETYMYPARDGVDDDAFALRTLVSQQTIPCSAFVPPHLPCVSDVPAGAVMLATQTEICNDTVPPGVFRSANWFISALL